jgi:hypothetical protein
MWVSSSDCSFVISGHVREGKIARQRLVAGSRYVQKRWPGQIQGKLPIAELGYAISA